MIYVDARGRIGNQMFQYAVARRLQLITGQKMVISSYNLKKHHPDWPYLLDHYCLNENVIHTDKKLPLYANVDGLLLKIFRHFFPKAVFNVGNKLGIYIWMGNDYKRLDFRPHKNYYFVGTWQCETYFEDINEFIRNELTPKCINYEKNAQLYSLMESTESVCVSIRRGDYVNDLKTRQRFFICDEDYFAKAIEMVKRDIPNATLFLFSDDVEWARQTIKYDGMVYSEDGDDTIEDKLNLMRSCKHFILSNSTFSWWSQYLSNNKNKHVYAPSRWEAIHKSKDECALYSDDWTLIEV